jgi:fused signal recognition particle receptor
MENIHEILENLANSYGSGAIDNALLIFAALLLLLTLYIKGRKENKELALSKEEIEAPKEKKEAAAAIEPESLSKRLKGTRRGLFDRIRSAFSGKDVLDNENIQELEALLVGSDLGVKTVGKLLGTIKASLQKGEEIRREDLSTQLKSLISEILRADPPKDTLTKPRADQHGPKVLLLVGVNGVGKTTTAAKLADYYKRGGAKVVLAAADTFRAAAVQQLEEWGNRIDVPVVRGADQSKPATVVFDAMLKAGELGADILIVDTAGRLHTKTSLMQELEGVRNSIVRHNPTAPHEVLLVVDGTTGQNALSQAKEFHEATSLTGIVVTKLDGTAKGGIVVAIKEELHIPVRFIGVGESFGDLREFNSAEFADALCGMAEDDDEDQTTASNTLSAHGESRRKRREQAG